MIPTPEQAYALVCDYNEGEFHRKHARIVGDVMRWYANELGYGAEADFWQTVGILHDLDFEQWPEQHCTKEQELMREKGIDERIIHATASHGWNLTVDIKPEHEMEKGAVCRRRADWSDRCLRHHAAQQERAGSGSKKPEKEVQEQKSLPPGAPVM